jgi:hypothetical protein
MEVVMNLQDWLRSFFGKNATVVMPQGQIEQVRRVDRFAKAWNAYYGRMPDSLSVKPGKPNDNVKLNFMRLVVDQSVDFLFGKEIVFEIDELKQTKAEEWLAELWRVNQKMIFLQKLAVNGAVCGQAFVKIADGGEYPRLIALDPGIVDVVTEPGDYETVRAFTITYPAGDVARRQLIRRADGGWEIIDQEKGKDSSVWATTETTPWPHDWPPIVYCQNLPAPNEFWGMSDIEEDAIQLNESINFVLSNVNRILRYHAHPKTWARGVTGNNLTIGADGTILLPDGAEMHNLEMTSDLDSSIELYKRLKEALHETLRSPEIASGKVENVGNLSGVALQILYQPLLSKTQTKRRVYGTMLVELNRRLLELGGFGAGNITEIHWPEILPRDPMQERQASLLDLQLGVSQDTILRRLDFDPQLESQKRAEETGNLGDALLAQFEQGKA